MDENKIIPYVEPIFRFCCKRLSNRYDAEDLASEIICHVLDGITKYNVKSLDAWVCQYDIIRTNGKILDFQGVLAFVGAHSIPFPALKGGTN